MDVGRRSLLACAAQALLPGLALAGPARRGQVCGDRLPDMPGPTQSLRQTFLHRRMDGHTDWRITIRQPAGQPPAGGWPVIYLLDGNAVLQALSEHERLAQGLLLVAVGYDTSERFDTASRAWDYTPLPPGARGSAPDPRASTRLNGGADAFLAFLRQLHDEIGTQWPIDPRRRTLYGHSYGGLFVLHALLTQPQAFDRYVAASPSLWWHAPLMTQRIASAPQRVPALPRAELLVLAGGAERVRQQRCTSCATGTPTPGQAEGFVRDISARPDLHAAFRLLPGLSHGETLNASLPFALRLAAAAGNCPA